MFLLEALRFLLPVLVLIGAGVSFLRRIRSRPSVNAASSLRTLQQHVASGEIVFPAEFDKGIRQRIEELIEHLAAADAALRTGSPGALGEAAKKLAYCHWLTGLAWRKYLAGSTESYEARKQVDAAFAEDARPLMDALGRLLSAQAAAVLVRKASDAFALACAACGHDAVTFLVKDDTVQFGRLSSINTDSAVQGEPAKRLIALLPEGDGRAVVDFLLSPVCPGCDAYCPDCGRVYCAEHFAVETEWSGSWATAVFATCPLGHTREID